MSSHHREILAALEKLKSGQAQLNSEQYVALLDAVEQAAEALQAAPRGADPQATGIWFHHERSPALARLRDALTGGRGHAVTNWVTEQDADRAAALALQQALDDRPSRAR